MGLRDILKDLRPIVLIKDPRMLEPDEFLFQAWNGISDEGLSLELNREIENSHSLKAKIDHYRLLNGPDVALYRASVYRISKLKRIQALRK